MTRSDTEDKRHTRKATHIADCFTGYLLRSTLGPQLKHEFAPPAASLEFLRQRKTTPYFVDMMQYTCGNTHMKHQTFTGFSSYQR